MPPSIDVAFPVFALIILFFLTQIRQFEITRPQAERALTDAKGDINLALTNLISP